jgi:hypothetical protein
MACKCLVAEGDTVYLRNRRKTQVLRDGKDSRGQSM